MSKNEKIRRDAIVTCAVACEGSLRAEQRAVREGEFADAAYWADRAEHWSREAFEWTAL